MLVIAWDKEMITVAAFNEIKMPTGLIELCVDTFPGDSRSAQLELHLPTRVSKSALVLGDN
jgi:hypothetical protein